MEKQNTVQLLTQEMKQITGDAGRDAQGAGVSSLFLMPPPRPVREAPSCVGKLVSPSKLGPTASGPPPPPANTVNKL